ncbi:MAG: hypothetical protein FJZ01_18145 [Candidatus Sericytochromatia bacterium]|nr:hypothetical protein [Candidatus Tanganyikabacteria bacterium]
MAAPGGTYVSEIFGFGPFLIQVPVRVRHRSGRPQGKEPGPAPLRAEPGSRPSGLDMASEASAGLGAMPDFSRPVTRTRAS